MTTVAEGRHTLSLKDTLGARKIPHDFLNRLQLNDRGFAQDYVNKWTTLPEVLSIEGFGRRRTPIGIKELISGTITYSQYLRNKVYTYTTEQTDSKTDLAPLPVSNDELIELLTEGEGQKGIVTKINDLAQQAQGLVAPGTKRVSHMDLVRAYMRLVIQVLPLIDGNDDRINRLPIIEGISDLLPPRAA